MAAHTAEEIEAFAQAYILDEDKTRSYMKAKPNCKAATASVYSLACRMASHPEVVKRIDELKALMRNKAESSFGITTEWRINKLKEVVEAGLEKYVDQNGNSRRENLSASRAAIQTMNEMLGVSVPGDKANRKSFSVNLRIEDASAESDDG